MRASETLFVERGFEAVGMSDIAQTLGVSRPTVYAYFPSPEGILDALLDERLEQLPRRLRPYLSGSTDTPYGDIFRALLSERELLMLLGSGGGPMFRTRRRAFLEAVETRLELRELRDSRGAARGQPQPPTLLPLILNLLTGLAYDQVAYGQPSAEELAEILDPFIRGGVEAVLQQP